MPVKLSYPVNLSLFYFFIWNRLHVKLCKFLLGVNNKKSVNFASLQCRFTHFLPLIPGQPNILYT
jgi:hypothetical protein